MKLNKLNNRNGIALIWVIFVFMIQIIIMSTMFYLQRQNILEAARQEVRLQTYYISLAGIDLTYAAIMEINNNEPRINSTLTDKIGSYKDQVIEIKTDNKVRGTANVRIDRVTEVINGRTIYWLRITSVGQLKGKDVKVKSIMRINEKSVTQVIRES